MPSDDSLTQAREAVRKSIDEFRSALAMTVEQVRTYLDAHRPSDNGATDHVAAELGNFAAGRIDVERFATLFKPSEAPVSDVTLDAVRRALETLSALVAEGDDLFVIDVPEGGDVRDAVERALASLGRAFGAARIVDHARSGTFDPGQHLPWLDGFRFDRWNRAEREMAPPLIVRAPGAMLYGAALASYLDGRQKIVLLVTAPAPPAPLARLISPGIFAIQTADASNLSDFGRWAGPGVAAVMPNGAALFTHDPSAGDALPQRLIIHSFPDEPPKRSVGGQSARQLTDELAHLETLRQASAAPTAGAGPAGAFDAASPADKLAAWLIKQADLSET
ncbi:MAG TPA: hypothetical protein VLA20_11615 [Vicinamibacterales bacterium]|nr:hypothetical protein [Vicinamibacterales bacterium]